MLPYITEINSKKYHLNYKEMDNTQHPNNYDNKAAHDTLKKMMMRKDILDLFFNIDKYGFCSVRVKSSKQPNSIEYQIGYDGYVWIMAYLMQGNTDDSDVNPSQPIHGNGTTGDEYRKQMLVTLADELSHPDIQKEKNSAFTKYGKTAYYMNFTYGIIHFFYMQNNEGIDEFLEAKELI